MNLTPLTFLTSQRVPEPGGASARLTETFTSQRSEPISMFPSLAPTVRSTDCRARTYCPASSGVLRRVGERLAVVKYKFIPHVRLSDNLYETRPRPVQVDIRLAQSGHRRGFRRILFVVNKVVCLGHCKTDLLQLYLVNSHGRVLQQ